MNHHVIKILPEHYNNVKAGTKTFEIRNNDGAYQKGDLLTMEYVHSDGQYASQLEKTKCGKESLKFTIGDVYPIDDKRVVFSLLTPPTNSEQGAEK